MSGKRFPVAMVMTVLAASTLFAGEVKFTSAPSLSKDGANFKIAFAISTPSDVEVAVVDSKGQVVRHLAAGLIGEQALEPFKPGSLSQAIVWDGKDDRGKIVAADGVKARVRIGMRTKLDKYLGWDGNTIGCRIVGLCVDERGELYVLDSDSHLKVYDRNGKYLRSVMPYPANLPKERTEGVGQLEIDGQRIPIVYNTQPTDHTDGTATLCPFTAGLLKQRMAFGPKGALIIASAVGSYINHGAPRYLLALHREGGNVPGLPFVGPKIREAVNFLGSTGELGVPWFDHLAVSADGETIYLNEAGDSSKFARKQGIFRVKWSDPKLGDLFAGKPEAGADEGHFDDPQGIALDKAGNLYVCDRGNNRVVIFTPDGKRLGQFAADAPELIAVRHDSGDVYLVSHKKAPKQKGVMQGTTLRKYTPWRNGDTTEVANCEIKTIDILALDQTSQPPKLWLAINGGYGAPSPLQPVIDSGTKLELGSSINTRLGLEHPVNLAVDPARNRVVYRECDHVFLKREYYQVDLSTGKKTDAFKGYGPGTCFALDKDGNMYFGPDYLGAGVTRLDPAGKPLAFPALNSNKIATGMKNMHWSRSITIAPNGDIYVLHTIRRHEAQQLDIYNPDGTPKAMDVVKGLDRGTSGLGVDLAGNIYLGVNLKTRDQPYPPEFKDKVPAKEWWFWFGNKCWGDRPAPWIYTYYNAYLYHWGSVMKFGPEGGTFYGLRPKQIQAANEPDPLIQVGNAPADAGVYVGAMLDKDVKVVGEKWRRAGFGIVPSQQCSWGDPGCGCAGSSFAVDAYGRTYYPNPFRFAVEIIDTAGNLISRSGSYGNPDSRGPGSPVPQPEIAFAQPYAVSVAEDTMYVSDALNQRIAVVQLRYAAQAEAAAK